MSTKVPKTVQGPEACPLLDQLIFGEYSLIKCNCMSKRDRCEVGCK